MIELVIRFWRRLRGKAVAAPARTAAPPTVISSLELPVGTASGPLLDQIRRDLAAMEPDALRQLHIARAGEHLAAILETTQAAVNQTRRACDALEAAAKAHPGDEPLTASALRMIRESCRAQEVSVARLRKVANTLDYIGSRLGGLEQALQVPTGVPANNSEALCFDPQRRSRGGRA